MREAVRLRPDYAEAHDLLGILLEGKGDREGALAELRTASELEPGNADYKQDYERVLQKK